MESVQLETPRLHDDAADKPISRLWPDAWWKIVDFRIGVVPLPVFFALVALVLGFAASGKVVPDILTSIAILAVGGFLCAEIGKRAPVLRHLGAAAILATFVPSYLAFSHALPAPVIVSVTQFTKSSNILYLFISSIIVGSILGMDRQTLVSGFLKIFVPMTLGSVAAAVVGTLTGMALGMSARHALFFVVVPVMAGGVGEGAIPLSLGYSTIVHQSQDEMLALVLPPVMMGSLFAVLISGVLNYAGKIFPQLTGEGRLLPVDSKDGVAASDPVAGADNTEIGAGLLTAVTLYLAGALAQRMWGWPAPITMLFLAVLLKLTHAVSPSLQRGAFSVYRFFATAVTYPLLFAIGVSMTPWDKLVTAFTTANTVTIAATVLTLVVTGLAVARFLGMYPIDVAIVNVCRGGQGGTGDVAILTAANRIQLMPFAQIATRIGGAVTVTLSLIALSRL